jgi:hypothetical protein
MFRKSIFVDLVAGEEGLIGLRPQEVEHESPKSQPDLIYSQQSELGLIISPFELSLRLEGEESLEVLPVNVFLTTLLNFGH